MVQKLPVNNFQWIKNTSQFSEDVIKKNYNEELHDFHNDLPFLPEMMNNKKFEKLVDNFRNKL